MRREQIYQLLLSLVLIFYPGCSGDSGKNSAPVANAGADAVISVRQMYRLDGTGSSDPDGDALSYEWSLNTAPEGIEPAFVDKNTPNPVLIPYEKGQYWIQLVVSDGKEQSEVDFVQITAVADAFEPVAEITIVPQEPKNDEIVWFSGEKSHDPNNDPLNYTWNVIIDGQEVFYPLYRSYRFRAPHKGQSLGARLTVDDSIFRSLPVEASVTVANTPPYVDAGLDRVLNGDSPPYSYNLNASASDADGDSLSYEWLIFRAPNGSGASLSSSSILDPIFSANMEGFYVLRFRAYDGTDWSVPDYITLCKGTGCPNYEQVVVSPSIVKVHPFRDMNTGKFRAEFSASDLTITRPSTGSLRWVTLWSPSGAELTVLDPSSPATTTLIFTGEHNLVGSMFALRLEADYGDYQGSNNFTFLKSSSDTGQDLRIFFENNAPEAVAKAMFFKMQPERVYQKIPLSISASDLDGDLLSYYWSVVSKPPGSEAFFSSYTNRPDPVIYAGKGKDALGKYRLRVIVEDSLGDPAFSEFDLVVTE